MYQHPEDFQRSIDLVNSILSEDLDSLKSAREKTEDAIAALGQDNGDVAKSLAAAHKKINDAIVVDMAGEPKEAVEQPETEITDELPKIDTESDSDEMEIDDEDFEDKLDESALVLMEVTPPGMEDWVKKNKAGFKKQYGDRWKEVLYSTAWKKYKKEEGDWKSVAKNYWADNLVIKSRKIVKDMIKNIAKDGIEVDTSEFSNTKFENGHAADRYIAQVKKDNKPVLTVAVSGIHNNKDSNVSVSIENAKTNAKYQTVIDMAKDDDVDKKSVELSNKIAEMITENAQALSDAETYLSQNKGLDVDERETIENILTDAGINTDVEWVGGSVAVTFKSRIDRAKGTRLLDAKGYKIQKQSDDRMKIIYEAFDPKDLEAARIAFENNPSNQALRDEYERLLDDRNAEQEQKSSDQKILAIKKEVKPTTTKPTETATKTGFNFNDEEMQKIADLIKAYQAGNTEAKNVVMKINSLAK